MMFRIAANLGLAIAALSAPVVAQQTTPPPQDTQPPAWTPAPPPPMQAPDAVATICFTDGVQCFTNTAYVWSIGSTNLEMVVPEGFVTDFASIPPGMRNLFERHGLYSRAALIHDYLYWSRRCTRVQADNLFLIAMAESEVPWGQRRAIHAAVRAGGGVAWQQNAADHARGFGRVIPLDRATMANRSTWSAARAELRRSGVTDPPFIVDPRVCALGNSTAVP